MYRKTDTGLLKKKWVKGKEEEERDQRQDPRREQRHDQRNDQRILASASKVLASASALRVWPRRGRIRETILIIIILSY